MSHKQDVGAWATLSVLETGQVLAAMPDQSSVYSQARSVHLENVLNIHGVTRPSPKLMPSSALPGSSISGKSEILIQSASAIISHAYPSTQPQFQMDNFLHKDKMYRILPCPPLSKEIRAAFTRGDPLRIWLSAYAIRLLSGRK